MGSRGHQFILTCVGVISLAIVSCTKISLLGPTESEYMYVASELNSAIDGLVSIALAQEAGKAVVSFNTIDYGKGIQQYNILLDDGSEICLRSGISTKHLGIPIISILEDAGDLYWTLDEDWIVGDHSEKVKVFDSNERPVFVGGSDGLSFVLKKDGPVYSVRPNNRHQIDLLHVSFLPKLNCVSVELVSGLIIHSIIEKYDSFIKKDVMNQAYYKDVFLDAGIGLTSRKKLYAAQALGLSLEYVSLDGSSINDIQIQEDVFSGSLGDENGRLLYPDGSPRYRLLFVDGGNSRTHGESLRGNCLDNMRAFIDRGGSYVGTCAGAFFASCGYDDNSDYPYYLHAWPGTLMHTGISGEYTDMIIDNNSPLLLYYDFGGDGCISNIRHNKGGYPLSLPDGTEVLARYYYPQNSAVNGQPSVWAYKYSEQSGRIVMVGSHPEEVKSGERRDLTAAMIQYAMDGGGVVSIKGYLRKGSPRMMNLHSSDNLPAYTCIGDGQVHHFAVFIPNGVSNISISFEGAESADFLLMMCRDTYAFESTADFYAQSDKGKAELLFDTLQDGIWYIGVQCLTKCEALNAEYGQKYFGRTEVLNGIPYSICIDWKEE